MHPILESMLTRFRNAERTRLLAFGSSNTARFAPGTHWTDVLELGVIYAHGPVLTVINTGICGDTSRGLLGRFETDAGCYRPHVVLLTIGGNDASPDRDVSADEFRGNLLRLQQKFADIGCAVVFQTYYAPDPDQVSPAHIATFAQYSQIVRDVADETGSALIDHLARWERLRVERPDLYKPLMLDGFHLNTRGNLVLGLDVARQFGGDLAKDAGHADTWRDALTVQRAMDELG